MPPARRGRASDALDGMVSSATPSPSVRRRAKSPAARRLAEQVDAVQIVASAAHYGAQSFVASRASARRRLGFLRRFLVSANIMKSFSELLKDEIELTFSVSMLIGHGGDSGGQTVSAAVIRVASAAAR